MYLEKISQAGDIKKLNGEELVALAQEIREFLIEKISNTGGHLASNLGVVELTMALHLVFDLPEDKIVWDVGHQAYTHKLLTGRREGFDTLRKYGGMSGFPKRKESDCDAFDTGHSSTSISAGLGLVRAREILGGDNYVISVIGDGSLTGGMAYEAMNNAARLKSNFIIVLNDNNMSISENVGGMSNYLGSLRTADGYLNLKTAVTDSLNRVPVYGEKLVSRIRRTKNGLKQLFIPGMLFENMGLTYLGPVDGHDLHQVMRALEEAKKVEGAVLLHVFTKKGKGYAPAERHPARFHGAEPFEIATGLPKNKRVKANWTDVFSTIMRKMGERDPKVVAVTAAMEVGTGLKRFHNNFPDRFLRCGDCRGTCSNLCCRPCGCRSEAGGGHLFLLPCSGPMIRSCMMSVSRTCRWSLPLTGQDWWEATERRIREFLICRSYRRFPNLCIMAPKNKWELSDMMKFAVNYDGPIAIRYPRGEAYDGLSGIPGSHCLRQKRSDLRRGRHCPSGGRQHGENCRNGAP